MISDFILVIIQIPERHFGPESHLFNTAIYHISNFWRENQMNLKMSDNVVGFIQKKCVFPTLPLLKCKSKSGPRQRWTVPKIFLVHMRNERIPELIRGNSDCFQYQT